MVAEQVNIDSELLDGSKDQYIVDDSEDGLLVLQDSTNPVFVNGGYVTLIDVGGPDDIVAKLTQEMFDGDVEVTIHGDDEPCHVFYEEDISGDEISVSTLEENGFKPLELIN